MQIDGRTLSHQTLETIRKMAIQRVKEGEAPSAVMKSYGFCRTTIYKWLRAVRQGGLEALRSRRGTGRPSKLSPRQKQAVMRWLRGRDPRDEGFDSALWTRKIISQLILEKFGISLSLATVGRLLSELGITPHKALRRAYERDPVAVERWKSEAYPALLKRAQQCGADIFFLDEVGIRSDAPVGWTWAPRGQKAEVRVRGKRQHIDAISAISRQGAFWYETFTGNLNAGKFIGFLRKFLHSRHRPVFLVLDNHPAHRADAVAQHVRKLKGRLELHFLPGYAPDLNPDEFVWNYLKNKGMSRCPLLPKESLRMRVELDLARIQNRPVLVRSFFQARTVA